MRAISKAGAVVAAALFGYSSLGLADDHPYTEGTVWDVAMIRVKPGKQEDYYKSLLASNRKVMDEAKKQGLVLSYKILSGASANPQDWDYMIVTEYPNMAAFDSLEAKMDAIGSKIYGSMDKSKKEDEKGMTQRAEIREIFGGKLMRELIPK